MNERTFCAILKLANMNERGTNGAKPNLSEAKGQAQRVDVFTRLI